LGSELDFGGIVVEPAVRNLALSSDAEGRFNTNDGGDVSSDFNTEVGGDTDIVTPGQAANTAGSQTGDVAVGGVRWVFGGRCSGRLQIPQ